MRNLWPKAPFWLPLLVLVAVLAAQIYTPDLFLTLRNFVFDGYQRWHTRPASTSAVLIVDIDEESLKRIGQWPWPRSTLASLIDRLGEMGAAVFALDVLLGEPDRSTPRRLLSPWMQDPRVRKVVELLPDNDALLAEAISRRPVSLGFFLSPGDSNDRSPASKAGFAFAGPNPTFRLPEFKGALTAIPKLEAAARGNGSLNFIPGVDGRIRRVPLLIRHRQTLYPSLAAEALRLAAGRPGFVVKTLSDGHSLLMRIGKTNVPLNGRGELWLHYSKPRASRHIPAWKVLEGDLAPERVRDCIVLVGTTATGLADQHLSALGDSLSGVEIHGQVIEQVLDRHFLSRPEWAAGAELASQVLASLTVVALVAFVGAVSSAILGLIVMLAFFAVSTFAFLEQGWLLDPLSGSVSLMAVYLVASVTRYVKTERERRWIQQAFSSYVSPNLVTRLIDHPEELSLGGERRECSFVLTDLADFTPLIEDASPEDLASMINEYIDRMTAIAFERDGTLDRIVGDAIAVMFSAPVIQPDHARRAVDCALAMDEFAQDFRKRAREQGLPIGDTRIGVHTGTVLVGNFGGNSQLDYRALGDAINTASRLEGANKYLGTRVCVSGTTARRCPDFEGRPVGLLRLKGKSRTTEAFEPLLGGDLDKPVTQGYRDAYRMLETESGAAEQAFAALAMQYPDDGLIRFHLRRLREGERGTTIVFRTK